MKKILPLLLILFACTHPNNNIEIQKQMLLKTDQDFSQMSVEKGTKEAFKFYAAEDVIMMREGTDPLFGKNELIAHLNKTPDGLGTLCWIPVKADVSGDLGYTFGKWQTVIKGSDSVENGTYLTVWKRQQDGTWKYVLDAGNTGKKSKK